MTTTEHSTVVGIFTDHLQAEQTLNELHSLGFTDDQLNSTVSEAPIASDIVTPSPVNSKFVEYMAVAAAGGAVSGGIVGAAASLTISSFNLAIAGGIVAIILGGVLVGAIAGGIVGILISQWAPSIEVDNPANEAQPITVTVNAPGREQEVADLLRRSGADNTTIRPDSHNATTADPNPPAT